MHKEAVECEATRLSVERHGGIQQAFRYVYREEHWCFKDRLLPS